MEDDNSMCERILRNLDKVIKGNPDLRDFIIVPAANNTKNKSPVLHHEQSIGLESWCIKHVYRYAYLELFESRKSLSKGKLPFEREKSLNVLLNGVLLINPDVTTFWNMKRELVENDAISTTQELFYTKLVLSYKTKSNETFGYRKWLLTRLLMKIPTSDTETIMNLLTNELNICTSSAEKSPNNYHSWTHRIWCLQHLGPRIFNFSQLVLQQLEFSQSWVQNHVSEHSGYHYRQYLFGLIKLTPKIPQYYHNQVVKTLGLVPEQGDLLTYLLGPKQGNPFQNMTNYITLLLFELSSLEFLNSLFPNHEAIWYHRRYLLYHLVKTAHEHYGLVFKTDPLLEEAVVYGGNIVNVDATGEKQAKLFKSQTNEVEGSLLYENLVKSERDFIERSLGSDLGKKYEKWLKFVLCMRNV